MLTLSNAAYEAAYCVHRGGCLVFSLTHSRDQLKDGFVLKSSFITVVRQVIVRRFLDPEHLFLQLSCPSAFVYRLYVNTSQTRVVR